MEERFLTITTHEEYVKRMEAEHSRQNARIAKLECVVEQINELAISTNSIAHSVKSIQDDTQRMANRIDAIESRDGEMWRKLIGYVITAIAGIIIGFLFKQIGM